MGAIDYPGAVHGSAAPHLEGRSTPHLKGRSAAMRRTKVPDLYMYNYKYVYIYIYIYIYKCTHYIDPENFRAHLRRQAAASLLGALLDRVDIPSLTVVFLVLPLHADKTLLRKKIIRKQQIIMIRRRGRRRRRRRKRRRMGR